VPAILPDQHPLEAAQAGPAVLLGDVEVHQPELMRLLDDVDRVRRVLVVLGSLRPDLLLGELTGERSELVLLVGQGERNARRRSDRHDPPVD
jgi:hypothetical protein